MLIEQRSHEEYIQFVEIWLDKVYPQRPPPIHAHVATMLMLVNLTPIRKISVKEKWHKKSVGALY